MLRRWGPRFLLYVLFIVAVAVAAAASHLGTAGIAVAMGATWGLIATLEWAVSRAIDSPGDADDEYEDPRRVRPARSFVPIPPVAPETPALVVPREPEPVAAEPEPEPVAAEPEPERVPEPALVEESGVPPEVPPPVQVPQAVPAEPAPVPEPEPEPEPVPVALVPEPPPARPQPEPAPEPQPAPVPVLASAGRGAREWNIWDLERLTRDASGRDAFKDEERSYLLMYLREFANADGVLPADFDALVRDSFGDLVGV
jgi:hypothetical protein